ncbi:DUF1214 domain-containing protein [Pandoraea terrae]|nr:DUF1214 domain-containing protein [Pandoraea terrae]
MSRRTLFKWFGAVGGMLGIGPVVPQRAAAAPPAPAGATPPGADALSSGALWNAFCDQLKAAGGQILRPEAPASAFDRAEGYRYLTRLLRAGLEQYVEFADPHFPVLFSLVDTNKKIGADNPDNLYQNAQIDGRLEYRITGHRGTVHYIGFSTKAGNYGKNQALTGTGFLDSENMKFSPDGAFELIISAKPHPGNWLPMTAETETVLVRQTFLDRRRETPATVTIECLNGPKTPAPLQPERFAQQLMASATFVGGTAKLFADWAKTFKSAPNTFAPQDQRIYQKAGGDPSIFYVHGYWTLAPDEALVVDIPKAEAQFWNFQVDNYWMESLDYRYFTIHLNQSTAKANPDGSVTLVLAHRDPGMPNWLSTAGHHVGTMMYRLISGKTQPYPKARVIRLPAANAPKT